jgi:hypothetical protein
MKLKVYSVYDSKAEVFMQPHFLKTKGEAVRAFAEVANDSSTQIGKYPEDFALFEIGDYDDSKGELIPLKSPTPIGLAQEFLKA